MMCSRAGGCRGGLLAVCVQRQPGHKVRDWLWLLPCVFAPHILCPCCCCPLHQPAVLLLVQQLPGLIRGGGPQVRVELNIAKDLSLHPVVWRQAHQGAAGGIKVRATSLLLQHTTTTMTSSSQTSTLLVVCLLAAVQVTGNPHAPGQVCNIKHLQRPQLATQLQARQLTAQVLVVSSICQQGG